MTFFYDLNKRMAALAGKQDAKQISEDAQAAAPKSRLAESIDVAEAGYSAKAGRAGKDLGKPGKNFAKIAKSSGGGEKGQRIAGAVLNKLRHPKESAGQEDTMDWLNGQLKDYDAQQPTKEGVDKVAFAKLAPPTDKITFADKIAGAKKEVDEMLGDVAAAAMKKAVNGHGDEVDEGYAEMDAWLKSREKEKGTGRFDKRKVSTGTVYTRKPETFDDPETDPEATGGAPKRRGRPKGKDKGPERVTAKSYKYKSGRPAKTAEDLDIDGVMMTQPSNMSSEATADNSALKSAIALLKKNGYNVSKKEVTDEVAPPGEKAERMVKGIKKSLSKDGNLSNKDKAIAYATTWKAKKAGKVEEESTDKEDTKAERAGKKVTKDIEYDEGNKGKDDNKAEKAGKKVTKDIEYDDKKDKEEKVKEGTKGGYNFGGGVYEGFNNRVESMITEGMNVSVNMSTGEDGQPHKNITISADGEDADKLAELLKMAGLDSHAADHKVCDACGSAECACDQEVVDENSPDWPTNTQTSDDALQYSGGLNKPKSTGQTTIPVVASQLRRQVSMEENVKLERSLFNTWKNYKG